MDKIVLNKNQEQAIFEQWYEIIARTYSAESYALLKETSKQFTNPLAYNIYTEAKSLFEAILEDRYLELIEEPLNNILKIRAVQDFTSSEAVGFILNLKQVFRMELTSISNTDEYYKTLSLIEDRIDQVLLKAFNIFMQIREKIYELKANEVKNRTSRMIERLNRKYDKINDTKGDSSEN